MNKNIPSHLKTSIYGSLALPRLIEELNSPYSIDKNAKAVVLCRNARDLKQAQELFHKLFPQSEYGLSDIRAALSSWLSSLQPRRLKQCNTCERFFFDRSRRIAEIKCDACTKLVVLRDCSTHELANKFVLHRKLPSSQQLERLLSLGHSSEPRHKGSDFLVNSCETCRRFPRTFFLTYWWVQSHDSFWRELIHDLPGTLREKFNKRYKSSQRNASGRKDAALALAWCIREADHWQALKKKRFTKEMENLVRSLHCTTWEILELTYLPPYDLEFLKLISATGHSSSLERKHASTYWGRGGVTRYRGRLSSQGFWTACGGPLAVHLRQNVKGKTWDEIKTVPHALWKHIIELWHLRYPDRELPSPIALGRRVLRGFSL